MKDALLMARVEREGEGRWTVLSPMIGWWTDLPHRGALLGPGSPIGALTRLNRRYRLLLPEGVAGHVREGIADDLAVPVAFGQQLFQLSVAGGAEAAGLVGDQAALGLRGDAGLPDGGRALVAPSDGIFYRRPTPGASAFVEVGQRIKLGRTVGLVEVMKTFNPIQYEGPGFPDEAEVIEVRVDDAQEVRAGEILIVLR